MTRMVVNLAIAVAVATLLLFDPSDAQIIKPAPDQIIKPAPKAKHVEIAKGPTLELAHDDVAIIRWATNNPGGDDDHYAVVHYGTDPKDLGQTAKNHIRLNQGHPQTVFRARLFPLKPKTTYYYTVTSMGYDGVADGEHSPVKQFTTPAPGERPVGYRQPQ